MSNFLKKLYLFFNHKNNIFIDINLIKNDRIQVISYRISKHKWSRDSKYGSIILKR